jgi:hypothetical protein
MPNAPVTIPVSNRIGFISTTHGISGLIQTPISPVGKRIIKIPRMSAKMVRNLLDSNLLLIKRKKPTARSKTPIPISARAVHKHFMGMLLPPGSSIAFPWAWQV